MSTPLTKRFILRHVSGVGKIDKMSAGDGPSPLVLCGPSGKFFCKIILEI